MLASLLVAMVLQSKLPPEPQPQPQPPAEVSGPRMAPEDPIAFSRLINSVEDVLAARNTDDLCRRASYFRRASLYLQMSADNGRLISYPEDVPEIYELNDAQRDSARQSALSMERSAEFNQMLCDERRARRRYR